MSDKLAIDGGVPTRTAPFPAWPIYDEREERNLLEVLRSGQWGIGGAKVAQFEQQFAEFQGARFGVCVPNGTLALQMALNALGVGPGDEVITTPYTFIATASAAIQQGATPVFVDIDLDTYNLDPARFEAAITPRTKAIVPVHLAGRPADMDAIMAVAQQHGLRVLEDACQAWGAAWRGRKVGAIGDLGTFSFQSSKNVSAGEGGIVITNDEALGELCWSLHNVGRVRKGAWYQHEIIGGNLRMSEWQAAVLLAQLERLPEHAARRDANARYLSEALSEVAGVTPLPFDARITGHAHHLFICRYDPAAFGGRSRDEFVAALRAEGIETASVGYLVSLNRNNAIRRAAAEAARFGGRVWPLADDGLPELASCPNAGWATQHTIWLAQNTLLGDRGDMDTIVAAARKIQRIWGDRT
jgi:dTDP-4-amino-4,6-dideoxygalactose transaminase